VAQDARELLDAPFQFVPIKPGVAAWLGASVTADARASLPDGLALLALNLPVNAHTSTVTG
jgi:hypothetical protein